MKVEKGRLVYDIVAPNRIQYSIPVYQRNYDWSKPQCEKLFNDILECARNKQQHFIGSIVNAEVPSNNKLHRYVIVDGQQRITTIFLLLKALYDIADSELDKQKLKEWMFNEDRYDELDLNDETKLKLKPIKSDNKQLGLLMSNKLEEMDKASNIYRNYEYFKTQVEKVVNSELTVREICDGVEDLICAIIELEPSDKPQEVFESINSTGKTLTISDLIRNFVLMTDEKQDELFEKYWLKIEEKIDEDLRPSFVIDYLNFRLDGIIKESDAYDSFKVLFKSGNYTNESMLQELLRYATIYNYFLYGSSGLSAGVNDCLSGLRQIKQTTIYVFLFKVFDDYINGIIDMASLEIILRFFLNYSVRRLLCNVASNTLRSLYKYLYARLFTKEENKSNYYDTILSYFMQLNTKDALIKDEELANNLLKGDLYHKNVVCKYVLYKLENHNSKEVVDVKNLTIEHIMPQNDYLNKSWKDMLGENWDYVHSTYLHTLGNLTLTGYNSELSDKPFNEKKQLLKNANSKIVLLNKDVVDSEVWNENTIVSRANRLSKLMADVFYIDKPTNVVVFKDEAYKEYTLDNVDEAEGLRPESFVLDGEKVDVVNFQDMLRISLSMLYNRDSAIIERIAKNNETFVSWSKRVYISYDKSLFKYCDQIQDTGIYYNTNLSAPNKLSVIKAMLNEYDIDIENFVYTAKKTKFKLSREKQQN